MIEEKSPDVFIEQVKGKGNKTSLLYHHEGRW
jgi:hypothetical protein